LGQLSYAFSGERLSPFFTISRSGLSPGNRRTELSEIRVGHVLRSTRKDLDLTPGAGLGHGTFRVRGSGNKKGDVSYLTLEQREAVNEALSSGYLADFEARFAQGELQDYPLWPGGRLKNGRAQNTGARTNRRTMLSYFHALEEIAAVDQIEGRGWYGLRRASSDRARRFTSDERIKNALGGWVPGSTVRARIYEHSEDETVLRAAADVRRRARAGTKGDAKAGTNSGAAEYMSPMQALKSLGASPEQLEQALAILGLEVA
jgi:hypothetical protein